MMSIKQPVVMGHFYPADPATLKSDVKEYLDVETRGPRPKAIIAPHAGYIYSGAVAGKGYACLKDIRDEITRVLLFGPSHRYHFHGLAVPNETIFETPLGQVPVDVQAIESLSSLRTVQYSVQAFAAEHSLEVQIPFLQETLTNFSIVPVLVSMVTPLEVAEAMGLLWGGPETLIVVSSDLSHYHHYEVALDMDRRTSDLIERLDWEGIKDEYACGNTAVKGLLLAAKQHGLQAITQDLRNSGDTAGKKDRVVGYGAFHFCEK